MNKSFVTGIFKEWVVPFFVSLTIVLIVKNFLYDPCRVHGLSMYPTLQGQEFIIVNKWTYRMQKPERGDIIVFHTKEKRDFIKRIIGLPGDYILIRNGVLFRNGKKVNESYINQPTYGREKGITVGNDELYVLGDNRDNSYDSRKMGPIKRKDVVGRADFLLYPFHEMRTFF